MQSQLTAFPKTEQILKQRIKEIDVELFKKTTIRSCSSLFTNCWGMCCSLIVGLTEEEAEVLTTLVKEKQSIFNEIGHKIPLEIIEDDSENNCRFLCRRKRPFSQLNKIIYALINFNRFNLKLFQDLLYKCVFSMDDGACSLERIAQKEGKHRWYYKPINCWKYPLRICDDGSLSVYDKKANPHFPCNRDNAEGLPASEALKEELQFFGDIIEQDLCQQTQSYRKHH